MVDRPRLHLSGIVLDAPDPDALATFYEGLLGCTRIQDDVRIFLDRVGHPFCLFL
jgi:hypothetical protein